MVREPNDSSSDDGPERLRRRADARRREILVAAARVFRRRGFGGSGMREIAAEAGLSPGNLYHYFEGKHAILFFCQDRALDRLLAALATARESRAPVPTRLRELLAAHATCLLDGVEGSAAHLEIDSLPSELRESLVAKRDRYERGVRELVEAGLRDGSFRCADPRLVVRAMLGALNWTSRWFRPDGADPARLVAERLAEYLVGGLGAAAPAMLAADDDDAARAAGGSTR